MAAVIGYGNLIDTATLTGWTNNANLKTRYLAEKATASGNLDIDLGSAKGIGTIALIACSGVSMTISAGSTVGGSDAYSASITGYGGVDTATTFATVTARYWRISATGFVGRIFIGPRFAPEWGTDWSPSISVESRTNVIEALSGPEYFDSRPNRRVWRGHFSFLSEAEGMTWLGVQQALDVSGEVYLFDDASSSNYRSQRNFYGRLRTLDAVEWPYRSERAVGVEVGELL